MPVHDWTRGEPGDFHDFHQRWTVALANALNEGLLPADNSAMIEQATGGPIPDVVTLHTRLPDGEVANDAAGVAVAENRPAARVVSRANEADRYARIKNRVVVRHGRGRVVAVVELVSPGNKNSSHAVRSFVEKAADLLDQGVHLLIVDLFPPTKRDPQGIHPEVWNAFSDDPFDFQPARPLTAAAYIGGNAPTANVETFAVGEPLPTMPLFLSEHIYVPTPLEATYQESWTKHPTAVKRIIDPPPSDT
ncbi:MAG: DUF4058 family protein [Planctomycetia bacterium]